MVRLPGRVSVERGFSMIDMLVVVAIIGIVGAISIPSMMNAIDQMRLGNSARELEREIQMAKSRAVGKGRPIRMRFNCPVAGQYRFVELIGTPALPTAADDAATRCSSVTYPYPPADNDPVTRPNLDGALRRLDSTVTISAAETIEFWPDGTARRNTGAGNPWPLIPVAGINIQLTRKGLNSTITVNGLGKIKLQ